MVMICQAVHAATECIRSIPVPPDTFVCVLTIESGDEMAALSERLRAGGIHHVMIIEPDPPYNGAPTAIGIEPMDRDIVRPFVAHLKVLR